MLKVSSLVVLIAFGLNAQANRQDFKEPSAELKAAIAAEATKQGYDLSTDEGRKQFGDYIKAQKDAQKQKADAYIKENNLDMQTKEGKEALHTYLSSTGESPLLSQIGVGKPPRMDERKKPESTSESTASNGETGNSDSRPQGPPPRGPRDQFENSGSANAANGTDPSASCAHAPANDSNTTASSKSQSRPAPPSSSGAQQASNSGQRQQQGRPH